MNLNIVIIIACGLISPFSSQAMQTRAKTKAASESFEDYVMERQKWNKDTRNFYYSRPDDSDVKMLKRYISVMKMKVEREARKKPLLEAAKEASFETGGHDNIFIRSGERFDGACAAVAYTEEFWTHGWLPQIETSIAQKSKQ